MVGFPYHLSHHHVYELAGHQLQSASAVPFSIDGLLNGSCAASVGNSNPLLSSGCGMNGDNQQYKLTGKPHYIAHNNLPSMLACCTETKKKQQKETKTGCCDTSCLLHRVFKGRAEPRTQAQIYLLRPPTSFHSSKAEDASKENNVSVSQ